MQAEHQHILSIQLGNYKNFPDAAFDFHPKLNCITGNNGLGKTNLLDAIYYTCVSKSYLCPDNLVFLHESPYFRIASDIVQDSESQLIEIKYLKQNKKEVWLNHSKQERITDFFGKFPVVMVTPNDSDLILGASENRRKFLDVLLSQLSREYLSDIMAYAKLLQQRNAALKSFFEQRKTDIALLQIYNSQLIPLGNRIYSQRKNLVEQLLPHFRRIYVSIFSGNENVAINYESDLDNTDMETLLRQNEQQDLSAQRTTKGIHTDDCVLEMNGFPLKKTASQGQQKTFLLALKLAQYEMMRQSGKQFPILLLDDIFDKLDSNRIKEIIRLVSGEEYGQVFFSDTEKHRMETLFAENSVTSYKIIHLGEL